MAWNRDKWEQSIIKKYGSLEAFRKAASEAGKVGGKTRSPSKGFGSMTPEQRIAAGSKGGKARKRK